MLAKVNNLVQSIVFKLDPFIKLYLRLFIGFVFVPAGWGKLHNLKDTIEFFQSLNIPAPQIQAPFVACVEFGLGLCVALGLFTRLATIPLMGTMIVALLTAHAKDITDINSLLDQTPFCYLTVLVAILALGGGSISLDKFINKSAK